MNDTSRNQGWAICGGAILLGLVFLAGILQESYWAIALPVAVLVLFVLSLIAWVGHTIATVQVEPESENALASPQTQESPSPPQTQESPSPQTQESPSPRTQESPSPRTQESDEEPGSDGS